MRKAKGRALLAVCILMLAMALPLALWCLNWANLPDQFYDPAYGGPLNPWQGVGAALGAASYLYGGALAVCGLLSQKRSWGRLCRLLALVLGALLLGTALGLRGVYLLTMLPLTFCGIIFYWALPKP